MTIQPAKISEASNVFSIERLSPHPIVGGDHGMADTSLSKRCSTCGITKPVGDFYRYSGRTSPRPYCKSCMNGAVAKSRRENPDRWRAYGVSSYYAHHDDRVRRTREYRQSEHGRAVIKKNAPAHNAKYRSTHKEEHNESSRHARKVNARRIAIATMARKYDIDTDHAERLFDQTICDLCGTSGRRMHTDHDHKTGTIRGRLCGVCNQGLGMFSESVSVLEMAIAYLQRTAWRTR